MIPPPDGAPLLEVRGVSKTFGASHALRGVSLAVEAASVLALAGENGAGKSTLMAVLSGALRPDEGLILWEGRPVSFRDVRAAQALGIGMVHQEPQLVPALSAAENIALGRLPTRARGIVDQARLIEQGQSALAGIDAAIDAAAPVQSLRPAQRQLVAIARALHFGARLIILDEPTSSLAAEEASRLFATVLRLRDAGTAFIYISHRLDELRAIAERVTVLRDGAVVLTAPLGSLDNRALIEAMSARTLEAAADHGERARGEVLLDVRGLGCRGRLHDVSLSVHAGEIVGVAGLMGAGRSRLLRALFGAERVDSGSVRVCGAAAPTGKDVVGRAIDAGLGLVPEDRRGQGLVLTETVGGNIGLVTPPGAQRAGVLRRGMLRKIAERAVAALGVKTRGTDESVRLLSGGNQQKVVLARWLAPRTRVLLLDEPTRGIDVAAKADVYRHLRAFAAEGKALLVVSSELPELLALSDRIYVMRQGRIAGELARAEASPAAVLRLATGAA